MHLLSFFFFYLAFEVLKCRVHIDVTGCCHARVYHNDCWVHLRSTGRLRCAAIRATYGQVHFRAILTFATTVVIVLVSRVVVTVAAAVVIQNVHNRIRPHEGGGSARLARYAPHKEGMFRECSLPSGEDVLALDTLETIFAAARDVEPTQRPP